MEQPFSDSSVAAASKTTCTGPQIMSNIFQSVHDSGNLTGTYRDTVLVRGAVSIKDTAPR